MFEFHGVEWYPPPRAAPEDPLGGEGYLDGWHEHLLEAGGLQYHCAAISLLHGPGCLPLHGHFVFCNVCVFYLYNFMSIKLCSLLFCSLCRLCFTRS